MGENCPYNNEIFGYTEARLFTEKPIKIEGPTNEMYIKKDTSSSSTTTTRPTTTTGERKSYPQNWSIWLGMGILSHFLPYAWF